MSWGATSTCARCLVRATTLPTGGLPGGPRWSTSARLPSACRWYTGGADQFRDLVACLRPHPAAYLRLRTLPGDQAQLNWGHFGHLVAGRAKHPQMAMRLDGPADLSLQPNAAT